MRVVDSEAGADIKICEKIRELESEVWEKGWVVREDELFGSVRLLSTRCKYRQ